MSENKSNTKTQTFYEGKSKTGGGMAHGSRMATGSLEVSIDNADTVIEGAPS